MPAGVTIAQTSLDAGWRLENGVAKYTRVVPSSTTMFASGDNTQNELLHLNVSNGGTPAEFLTGKKLTFKDSATYTDKSGFTNTTSDDVTVTVHALNPKKSIDGSDPGTVVGPVPTKSNVQVDIANITMEGDKSRVVNIAMPYVKTTTEDTRNIKLLGAYKGANGPASVKEVEISIDSNIDQNRAIEFYAIWTPTDEGKSTFVSYQNNPESLGLKSTLTFEVYSVANGTEKKIGEVSLRKGDAADKVALPDGITTVRLRPKGNMPLEASGLRQVGLFLSQDLKGLEEAKKIAKEGKKVESIVTSSVYTYGYDEPKVDVSKTTFANSREAIKLAPTTNPITATLAGNKTQELSSQYEVYEYSPNGLGNRIYNKQIFDRKTYVNLQDINAKNAKLLVELPDGFSYAGDDDSVKTVENYNNSGKTVLEVTPKNQNSEYTLSPNLQFKVDKWVESGKYPVKYTLVWDEDERVVGINPNNDYDGTNTTITNTSSFTYELPVINNSATRLMTQVTDQTTDSSTYSTGAYNLAPNDKVKYRLSLTNSSNAATRNNVVISTLPRVSDKNIVLNSKDRGSQFDVHMTAAATTPEGWTAYYSTTPVSGTAVDLEKTITLTADQVTDWSTVTAVKFVSNQDVALKAGSTAAFYIPAKASSTATNNQIAVLSSATRTDGQDTFNETNPARISIKIEDVKKGAVKVAYENKDNVPIKDTVTAIESRAYKKGYDVDTKEYKPDTLIGKDGKEYYFVKVKDSSPKPTGTIDSPEVTVTYVYDLLYEEITKATKQTVTYEGAGKKTPAPNEQKDYIFTKKTNKVTNVTTWNEETHTYEFVTTPKVEGYYADKAQAGGKEVTPTNPEASDKVVYKPLGKVILVDEGGNEIPNTPKPTYKNNPNDPTLGGETPIPEIPDGYEIKPKQDVPGFNPEGKVVTPQKPGEDTRIVLVKVNQKATVKYVVEGTDTVLHKDELEGKSGAPIDYTTATKLAELKAGGYELVTDGFTTATDKNYDNNPKVDQDFLVTVAKTVPVTPTTPQNPNEDPQNPQPGDPINPENPNGPKWTKEALDKLNNIKSVTRTITYIKDGTTEEVSPTEAPKWTDKVSFTRTVVVNPKDGSVVGYDTTGDGIADVAATDTTSGWKAAGTAKFTEKTSPVVKGYVVKPNQDTQGDLVEADGSKVKASTTDLTVDSPNQDLKVRYVPVGTWTPKVPEGETPINPIPYPNDPTDPGKVVDPNKPTDPNEPNKPSVPVIPHIPGTTPKDPEGNPLKPVDPQDPSKGYVPPTPKTPTENTEIKYEKDTQKDTQKATVKYVVEGTDTVLHTDELEGKSGEAINYSTTTKLADLRKLGYELVTDGFTTAPDKNFDKDTKVDQNFVVTVKPKVVDVPPFDPTNPNDQNTPKPGKPIDPNNPDGPKWTEELIKSLETTKHVNRTISYVKEDGSKVEYTDKDGNKSTADVTDKVTFTRPAKINVVTGTIEYGKWTPVNNDTTFDKVTSPVAPGYVLKDPAQKEIAETTGLTENSKDENIKVVYVPVGKLVPKVPEGVTPPTPVTDTPYENVPGEPGKVVPPSPTKPTDPQDPNSPKVPVIPHIPGTTPQVPKDPTKPVDPNTNPLVPLEPVTPGKPEEGYKVPPVPIDPTKNLEINYEKDTQKAVTKFVDPSGNPIPGVNNIEETGKSGEPLTKATEVTTEITKLIAKGYDLVSNNYGKDNNGNFDKDSGKDQEYTVVLTPHVQDVPPFDPTNPNDQNTPKPGKPIDPNNPDGPKWTEELIKSLETTKHVNRTISYVKEDGSKVEYTDKDGNKSTADVTDKVTFTRPAKINVVTGTIEYGKWTPVNNDTTFDKVTSPVAPGYVLKDPAQKEIAETTGLTENSKDENIKVVYVPVGTWTPKVPEGETPIDPIPYPNDPTDPGKVVDPNKPTDPNEPNKPSVPVIPHIPGTTPKDSEGNPLKPVDPQDPSKGYVPPTPKIPTENTEIKYEKDTQKATVKYVVEGTNTVLHTDELEGKSGEAINYSTADKLADLRKLGYELVTDGFTTAPDKNFDKDTKVDQNFVVTVKPKVVDVPPFDPTNPNDQNTPKPGKPIDPNNPDGPKWTEELIKSLETTKHVNRTISYVKEDGSKVEYTDKDGNKSTADVTDKVTFTRPAKINVVTGTIEYGKWTPVNNDTTFDKVTSPVAPGYVLKDPAQKEIAETTGLTENSKDENIKVVYVPVGKLVPKVPEGVTPPTPVTDTPYENVPGEPGKVVPPSPTKPTDPQDPNSPKVPVIPHIPGTTPQVPKDPTKPVDPNTNPLVPLEPVTPGKPEEGYKVPPVPIDPTKNLEINYEKDTQKAVTKFVDPSGNPIPGVNNIEETGKSGEPLTKATEVTTEITKLIAKGYDLVSNNYGKDNNGNFDKDSGKDQEYTVVLTPHVQDVPPFDPTNPNDQNTPKPGKPIDPNNPDGPKWTEELIKSLETTKHVNRTISYVKEDGSKVEYTDKDGNKSTADVTDKVTFTRPAKINVVTGTIEYGKWTPVNNDTTFDKVTSPVAPGYVLKDPAQKEIAETTGLTENSKDENIKVVYVPVGKLVPKVPEGVTPPTPVTDTPYENVPGEPGKVVPPSPTKPTDPQDPNSPKVPVIPHIPGTTPQVPKDPTKPVDPNTNPLVPLKPIDPQDPSKGYEVPPVPTDSTTNTPVNYVKDGQKAITNFVDNNGKVVSDPVVDQGDSGSKFTKSGEVESKIKELAKKGYVVTSNEYPSDDKDRVFDNDKDKDQIFNVKVTPLIVPTDPNSPDKPMVPTDPTKPVGPNNPLRPVTPSTPEPGKPVFPEDPNSPVWPETVKDMVTESSAARTITYVDQNGKEVAATHTETIKFKRSAKVNLVTGEITYGEWSVVGDDTILDGDKLPKVDGYIARGGDIKESQEDIKATVGTNITQTVVYDKLGSWVPKVPENATPVPPITYPNDPTDPTKPGTDKLRVPHVPGFIPVGPDGTPLKTVDPKDPSKGYEVPDVPTDPTKDTPISYVPVTPEKPTPERINPKPTPVVPVQPEGPVTPATPKAPAKAGRLANTGTTETNTGLGLGILGVLLAAARRRKEKNKN